MSCQPKCTTAENGSSLRFVLIWNIKASSNRYDFSLHTTIVCFIKSLTSGTTVSVYIVFNRSCYFFSQGDLADCFYIVESGHVRITMKRSKVSLRVHICVGWFYFASHETQNLYMYVWSSSQKMIQKRRNWRSPRAPGGSILENWLLSPTSHGPHLRTLWTMSSV